ERFITLFIGRIDLRTRQLDFVNAGHNAPLLTQLGTIEQLRDGSIALGMMPKLPFLKPGSVQIGSGSRILCYTDGLIEQEDRSGIAFEIGPLEQILKETADQGPEETINGLKQRFEKHRNGVPYLDDIAVLACSFD